MTPLALVYLWLLPFMLLLVIAAPQPRPASMVQLKQTTRQEILQRARAPQRRTVSAVSYPVCPLSSATINAALYSDRYNLHSALATSSEVSLEACIQKCVMTTGCVSGDYHVGGGCWLTAYAQPVLSSTNVNFKAFVLNTDCTAFAPFAPAGATCCNY